jgi:hypothetical protein
MISMTAFQAWLTEIFVMQHDGLVRGGSRGDLISVLAKESPDAINARTDAEMMSEIKARLQQEAWISGRGFLY